MRLSNIILWAACLAALLCLQGCDTKLTPVDTALKDYISAKADSLMQTYNLPGMTVGLWLNNSEPYLQSFGVSNTISARPLSKDDVFRMGSLSQTITATAVLKLVEAGKLSLDNSLNTYITTYPNGAHISVRQLLNMSSGIGEITDDPTFANNLINSPSHVYTSDQLVSIIASLPVHFTPGARVEFCSSNYILLGKVMEVAGGDTYTHLISSDVLQPAFLLNTHYPDAATLSGSYAHGYVDATDTSWTDVSTLDPSFFWSQGSLTTNISDLGRWIKTLAQGSLLNSASLAQQTVFTPVAGQTHLSYGLGIAKWDSLYGQTGNIRGYNTSAWYYPDKQATIVVMANKYNASFGNVDAAGKLVKLIVNKLWPNTIGK